LEQKKRNKKPKPQKKPRPPLSETRAADPPGGKSSPLSREPPHRPRHLTKPFAFSFSFLDLPSITPKPATPGETHTCSRSSHSYPAPASTTTAAVSPYHSGAVSSSSPQRWQQQQHPTARSLSTDPPHFPPGQRTDRSPSTPALQGHTAASHLAVSFNQRPQTSSSMVQRPAT
jgi:hypothetical protein